MNYFNEASEVIACAADVSGKMPKDDKMKTVELLFEHFNEFVNEFDVEKVGIEVDEFNRLVVSSTMYEFIIRNNRDGIGSWFFAVSQHANSISFEQDNDYIVLKMYINSICG